MKTIDRCSSFAVCLVVGALTTALLGNEPAPFNASQARVVFDLRELAIENGHSIFRDTVKRVPVAIDLKTGHRIETDEAEADIVPLTPIVSKWLMGAMSESREVTVQTIRPDTGKGITSKFSLDGASMTVSPTIGDAVFTIVLEVFLKASSDRLQRRLKRMVWDGQTVLMRHPVKEGTLLFLTPRIMDSEGRVIHEDSKRFRFIPRMRSQPKEESIGRGKGSGLSWEDHPETKSERDGADQPATAPKSEPKGKEKPKPESKERSQ